MEKVILFGIGKNYKDWSKKLHQMYEIVALVDNAPSMQGVFLPKELLKIQYDKILIIAGLPKVEICKQCMELGVPFEKIEFVFMGKYKNLVIPKKFLIDNHIVLEYYGIKMIMDNGQEFCAINEAIIGKNYELGLGNDNYCVIDIGANVGDTALYFASLKEVNTVYAYEPFRSSFDKALKNAELNPSLSNKIQLFNIGISDENAELLVNTPEDTFGVSINDVQKGQDKIIIKEASELLGPIINTHLGKQKILLKLDCEGSEYDIIENLDKSGLLSKIDVIIGEWHFIGKRNNGNTEINLHELQESLTRNNFLFRVTYEQMFCAFRK